MLPKNATPARGSRMELSGFARIFVIPIFMALGFAAATIFQQLLQGADVASKGSASIGSLTLLGNTDRALGADAAGGTDAALGADGRLGSSRELRLAPKVDASTKAAYINTLLDEVSKKAGDDVREKCLSIIQGRPGSLADAFAQGAQDWLLFHNYFFHIPYGQGSYLDIGSNHPKDLSNTFFFDRCLGWRGVCIEPNAGYHPLYPQFNRTCTIVSNCVSDKEKTMGLENTKGPWGGLVAQGSGMQVECRTLPEIIEENKLENADLASLDIEGSEYPTLRCFPFRGYPISTWVVETNKASINLYRLFARGGYAYVADILYPNPGFLPNISGIGEALDSVFRRIDEPFVFGPSFLPGGFWEGIGPRGACHAGDEGVDECPEQAPVITTEEVNRQLNIRGGACGLMRGNVSDRFSPKFRIPLVHNPSVYKG